MEEQANEKAHRDSIAKQYRDWIIPATLLVGVAAGVLMLAIQLPDSTIAITVAATLAFTSIVFFVLSLFWAVTRLESIEILGRKPHEPGPMFALSSGGVLTLLASLSVFCFVKTLALGIASVVVIALAGIALVKLLQHEAELQ